MLTLGDILGMARRSAGVFERIGLPASLIERVEAAASSEGLSTHAFVRLAVAEFSSSAHPDEWTQLMTRLRDCHDPGATCLEAIIERRLAHIAYSAGESS